ncbi:hypothetical protein [Sanguibacter massiliensis]|uniref:hypothetical protein n=1 Tax=Sanguibacter massiliensis TaxID=1973217 RepID=UPI000C85DCC7|nr:hypothetical protein [Sanguibacter massiliensis]
MFRRLAVARDRGNDHGAGSAEYLGVILLVVAIVGSLLLSATPIGSAIAARLCEAFGTTCGTASEDPTASRKPEGPCVVDTSTETRSLGVTAVIDLDAGGQLITEKLSDGTTRVTLQGEGSAGIGVGVGGSIEVTVDDFVYGGSAQASASAAALVAGGTTWEFPRGQEGDASKLTSFLQRQLDNSTTPVVGPIRGAWDAVFGDRYVPPAPTSYFGQVGVDGSASASASALSTGPTSAGAEAEAAVALGAKVDVRTGATTLYYSATLEGSAQAGSKQLTSSGDASASGELHTIIAVTLDPSGAYMTNVSIEGTAFGEADASWSNVFGANHDPSARGGVQYTAGVNLTDRESASIAADVLRSQGIPVPDTEWTPRGNTGVGQIDAFTTFVDAAKERGTVSRLTQTGDSSTPFAINASGKVGIEAGLRYENSSTRRTTDGAEYFDGTQWVPWTECVG